MKRKPRKGKQPQDLLFELDGPGVSPATVDSLVLLQFADACFRMAVKVAEVNKIGLTFQGLRVVDKCVAIGATPSNGKAARLTAAKIKRLVQGVDDPPSGTESLLEEVRRCVRALKPQVTAAFRVGKVAYRIQAPNTPVAESPWETTELRVIPIRAGGRDPTAELVSDSEVGSFILKTSEENARLLGAALYREIDVIVEICRSFDGLIERGKIVEVMPVDQESNPTETWRAWFADEGKEWEDIEDVGEALERRH